MAQIDLTRSEQDDRYTFKVTVRERGTESHHQVTLKKADYERLTSGEVSPDELVTASFRFLLQREPKESILSSFDLTVISRYFPQYEREIRKLW